MVDQTTPTDQFHPYQAPDATPHSERPNDALSGILRKVGLSETQVDSVTGSLKNMDLGGKLENLDVNGRVSKAREYARQNPGKVLGGLALAVIGMGLLGRRTR